jgi:hypothetical protein
VVAAAQMHAGPADRVKQQLGRFRGVTAGQRERPICDAVLEQAGERRDVLDCIHGRSGAH